MTRSFTSLAVLVIVTLSASAVKEISAAPSCMDVTGQLIPCLSFLNGYSDEDFPSPECCSGAQNIACQAQTRDDRRAICECLSSALASIGSSGSFGERIPLIATKCGSTLNTLFDVPSPSCYATLGKTSNWKSTSNYTVLNFNEE
ncbi:hypothetical protein GQ457_01G055080 [Hibiscus cannabinus]